MKKINLILVFNFLFWNFVLPQSNNEIRSSERRTDSILAKVKSGISGKELVDSYAILGNEYFDIQSLDDSAMKYNLLALDLAEKIKYKKGIGYAKRNLGMYDFYKNDEQRAVQYYLESLKNFEEIKDEDGKRKVIFDLGRAYLKINEFDKALFYLSEALKKAIEIKDKRIINGGFVHVGRTYYLMKDYTKATNNFNQYVSYAKSIHDTALIFSAYNDIGSYYRWIKKSDYAYSYLDSALKILGEKGFVYQKGMIYKNIANWYSENNQIGKGIEYANKALKYMEESGDRQLMAICLRNIGLYYDDSNNFKNAEEYLYRSLKLSKETKFRDMELFNYQSLYQLYLKNKRFDKALDYYRIYSEKKDSLNSVEETKKMITAEMNYDFEKKQAEIKAKQEITERLKEEEASKQKMIRNGFIIGFCLVFLFALFILKGYKQKLKANAIISQQKEEVEIQKSLVEEKNKEVMDSIRYAKRIQTTLMPSEKYIGSAFDRLQKNGA